MWQQTTFSNKTFHYTTSVKTLYDSRTHYQLKRLFNLRNLSWITRVTHKTPEYNIFSTLTISAETLAYIIKQKNTCLTKAFNLHNLSQNTVKNIKHQKTFLIKLFNLKKINLKNHHHQNSNKKKKTNIKNKKQ